MPEKDSKFVENLFVGVVGGILVIMGAQDFGA